MEAFKIDTMKNDSISLGQSTFLFNVDLLVHGESNALAMERLLHLLNQCGFADYRIKSGMELGRLIEELEAKQPAAPKQASLPSAPSQSGPAVSSSAPAESHQTQKKTADSAAELTFVNERIQACIADNRLIRLMINKGFGVKLNIPCRIINFDLHTQMLTVYHVDEKQVYSFTLNEIDDFVV
ncbi:hypothetical protein ACFPYJ_32775 [Paenibacillus solisilvae]|uniref:Uncharacterized protein n=1 Tax=Paenibacillus solisilvae TaxID=2486751 RepID=A0ABW0WA05_9BACL